jgi:hypothetical protein
MKHFVVKIIGGDKIGEGGLYYIAQGRTKWRNSRLTPENSRLPTWLGCFGCQQAAGHPKFLIHGLKISPNQL